MMRSTDMTSPHKKYKYQVDNNLRGAYGETDLDNKVIKINKKRHKSKQVEKISKKSDGTEHLGKTILHETLHAKHPKMTEKEVRKREKKFTKLSKKTKAKLYAKVRS